MSPYDLIGIVEAAAILQPAIGELNACNWLTDLRRAHPVYRQRVFSPPRWCEHCGRIKYPRGEIERLLEEVEAVKRMKPPLRS
jgi:hypothetical protein